jgi:hypothetical protein
MHRLQAAASLTSGSSGETDVAEASDGATAEALRDSADAIDTEAVRLGGGPAAKMLPRASRCCATDLQRAGEKARNSSSCTERRWLLMCSAAFDFGSSLHSILQPCLSGAEDPPTYPSTANSSQIVHVVHPSI